LGDNRAVRYGDLTGLAVPTCQVEHSIAGGDLAGLAFPTCQVERGIAGGDLTGLEGAETWQVFKYYRLSLVKKINLFLPY